MYAVLEICDRCTKVYLFVHTSIKTGHMYVYIYIFTYAHIHTSNVQICLGTIRYLDIQRTCNFVEPGDEA